MGLECLGDAIRRRDEIDPACFLMPIGRYAGKPLRQIDEDYLRWFLRSVQHRHEARWQVQREILRRMPEVAPRGR